MPTFSDKRPMSLYFVDHDAASSDQYETLAHRLGWKLRPLSCSNQLMAAGRIASPACLILDLDDDGGRAVRILRWLLDHGIDLPVILTATDTATQDAVAGLRLGAVALLGKPVSTCLLERHLLFAESRLRTCLHWEQRQMEFEKVFAELTERQKRVLDYAVVGMLNKTIAARLNVSKRTVEAERSKVLKAFTADSFYEVSKRMGQYGVLDELRRMRNEKARLRISGAAIVYDHTIDENRCGRSVDAASLS